MIRLPWRRPDSARGFNLFGYLRAESGVGEHARTLLAVFDEARIPALPIDFPETRSRREHPLPLGTAEEPLFERHLICVNADQTPRFVERFGDGRLGTAPRIGYWHWEVEEFPDRMAASALHLDAVWTASEHSAAAIRSKIDLPVRVLPPAVDPPPPSAPPAGLLPSGPGPLILTSFDYDSVFERKNPVGAIVAFRRAFPHPGVARLLLKSVNGEYFPELRRRVEGATGGRPDITIVDRFLSRDEQAALLHACDVFFSPHRAEGFGLMLAESMAAGKPVVATGYSGNLEFMRDSCGFLVPWTYCEVPPGTGPYSGRWAEPDLDAAADALRRVALDGDLARRIGERARIEIRDGHSVAVRAKQLKRALLETERALAGARRKPAGAAPELPVANAEAVASVSRFAVERRTRRDSESGGGRGGGRRGGWLSRRGPR